MFRKFFKNIRQKFEQFKASTKDKKIMKLLTSIIAIGGIACSVLLLLKNKRLKECVTLFKKSANEFASAYQSACIRGAELEVMNRYLMNILTKLPMDVVLPAAVSTSY